MDVSIRFDAEQRGVMTDSGAVEDSQLDGFDDPWPRPRYATAAAAVGSTQTTEKDGASPTASQGVDEKPLSLGSSPPPAAAAGAAGANERLVLPEGVLLKHAVQVWNALCVLPRPMGLRPPPTLDQLMRAIVTLSPRWGAGARGARRRGAGAGGQKEREGQKKEEDGDEDGEAEFDDSKASIRRVGEGGPGEKDDEDDEAKKKAQALLDGVCMSIVRVLSVDLHAVLGRWARPH